MFKPQNNISANCWANSLAQALYAQPHIHDYLDSKYGYTNNFGIAINNATLHHSGQQCAHEAFQIFVERAEQPIQQLFEMVTENINTCINGHKSHIRDNSYFLLFPTIPPPTQSLNDYLVKRNPSISGAICDTCSHPIRDRSEILRRVSKIITIVLDKFTLKTLTTFPHILDIPTHPPQTKLQYELTAVVEHSGCAYSGHYWAICKDFTTSDWYVCNDTSISRLPHQPQPSPESYLLFYSQVA